MTELQKAIVSAAPSEAWRFDEPAARHTTMRVGGPIDALLLATSAEDIALARELAERLGVPFCVFGNGSNLLVRDGGLRGIAVKLANGFSAIEWPERDADDACIEAQAGALLPTLARGAIARGLNMAWACGIPGTLGGAVTMNAGAYGGQMADAVVSAEALNEHGAYVRLAADELAFGYRHSVLHERPLILTRVWLRPARGDAAELEEEARRLLDERARKQPLEFPSCGSFFKRPPGDYAARLIDAAGLRGFRVGNAAVSEKHAGFIVNLGGAAAAHILALADEVARRVFAASGIRLEPEAAIVGEEASA